MLYGIEEKNGLKDKQKKSEMEKEGRSKDDKGKKGRKTRHTKTKTKH